MFRSALVFLVLSLGIAVNLLDPLGALGQPPPPPPEWSATPPVLAQPIPVPQPGQPAPSYTNILKAGFTVAYVRPNWTEPAT